MMCVVVQVWAEKETDYVELDCGHFIQIGDHDESHVDLIGSETVCEREHGANNSNPR